LAEGAQVTPAECGGALGKTRPDGTQGSVPMLIGAVGAGDRLVHLTTLAADPTAAAAVPLDVAASTSLLEQAYETQAAALDWIHNRRADPQITVGAAARPGRRARSVHGLPRPGTVPFPRTPGRRARRRGPHR
jgi:hypothetical protein